MGRGPPAEADQAVERLAAAKVDFIKVHDWLRPEVYAEVVRAARAKGLRVGGHIPIAVTVGAVLDSGQRDIEHAGNTTHGILRACSAANVAPPDSLRPAPGLEAAAHAAAMSKAYLGPLVDGLDLERCRILIQRPARDKVWQVPTLSFWQSIAENPPAPWNGPFDRLAARSAAAGDRPARTATRSRRRSSFHDPLLLEEVLLRHKRLRLFIMHAGWPFLDSMLALLYGHLNVYVDVAALENQTIVPREGYYRYLRALVESGFGKRIMFGSEFTNLFGAAWMRSSQRIS